MGRRDWGGEREREKGGEESLGRLAGGERWGGEMGERERERGGEERWGREVGRREREGEGSSITDQRGVRGTVRECVCMWRV